MKTAQLVVCLFVLALAQRAHGAGPQQLAIISDPEINEASGIAMSQRQADAAWIHNDSGDAPRLFLVGFDGATRGVLQVNGARALDWEDMCSFTIDDTPWLLAGDIGDNAVARGSRPGSGCRLYLFPEPDMTGQKTLNVDVVTTIEFAYEDGPHNCESVAVDTQLGEIYVVTKTKYGSGDVTGVYRFPLTLEPGTTTATAERIADLSLETTTAMDISTDGRRMVVITGREAILAERGEGETWQDALQRRSRRLRLPQRRQGETVCFGRSADELLLNSEHTDQPLWAVPLPPLARE